MTVHSYRAEEPLLPPGQRETDRGSIPEDLFQGGVTHGVLLNAVAPRFTILLSPEENDQQTEAAEVTVLRLSIHGAVGELDPLMGTSSQFLGDQTAPVGPSIRGLSPAQMKIISREALTCSHPQVEHISSIIAQRNLVNDDFCDCPESGGIDEPGTSACETAQSGHPAWPQFYCGYRLANISRLAVDDGVIDCPDARDERANASQAHFWAQSPLDVVEIDSHGISQRSALFQNEEKDETVEHDPAHEGGNLSVPSLPPVVAEQQERRAFVWHWLVLPVILIHVVCAGFLWRWLQAPTDDIVAFHRD
eukprot:TRINITY_DN3424_c0_g1_i2.p1 TRINITY_DN3424_c0_g1~~TRINITY_DN3424_c0_g1_i2.p1  ORF type:complete len:306 (-),score=56.86 TRINITY_DN3424_c0_g1_i2:20-937(-)